jgi:hypothetical protein
VSIIFHLHRTMIRSTDDKPSRKTVDRWLSSFWKRHFVLTLLPCLVVWIWVAIPFPVSDPYKDDPFPDIPSWPKKPEDGQGEDRMPLDVNFYFFLFWYVPLTDDKLQRS